MIYRPKSHYYALTGLYTEAIGHASVLYMMTMIVYPLPKC